MVQIISLGSILLCICYVFLVYYYRKGWCAIPKVEPNVTNASSIKFSIIVSIRNEERDIKTCLNSLLKQNYDRNNYEIIVIDDFSTDNTLAILDNYKDDIKLIKLSNFLNVEYKNIPNKKRAISLGVQVSKHNHILCADGDCCYGEDWINSYMQYIYTSKKRFVTAPVSYSKHKKLISSFFSFEMVAIMGATAAAIFFKKPTMANGGNMYFSKEAFLAVNGYSGNIEVPSGDDVFLMQKINKKYSNSIGFLKSKKAIVKTSPPETLKAFFYQRIRWASKASVSFSFASNIQGVVIFIFNLNLLLLGILGFYLNGIWILFFILFFIKCIIDSIYFIAVLPFFYKKWNLFYLFPSEIMNLFYIVFVGFLSVFGTYKWKERKIS